MAPAIETFFRPLPVFFLPNLPGRLKVGPGVRFPFSQRNKQCPYLSMGLFPLAVWIFSTDLTFPLFFF